jgi:hypothetical protein
MTPTAPVLPAVPREKVTGANGATLSPMQLVLGRFLIFDDGKSVYAYSLTLERAWVINSKVKVCGWAVQGSEIYVQDGPVLCQYGITELLGDTKALPANAVNLSTAANWTAQPQSDQSGFTSLFVATDLTGGPPAVWNSGLSTPSAAGLLSDGTIVALPANLVMRNATTTGAPPAPAVEIFAVPNGDGAMLRYLSGGNAMNYAVADLDHTPQAQSNLPPAAGEAHWRAMHRLAAVRRGKPSQDSVALSPSGAARIAAAAPAPMSDWLVLFHGKSVVRCSISGATLTASLQNAPAVPPVRYFDGSVEWFYSLTGDPNGDVYLEQYKFEQPGHGTSANAWPLIASQLGGVGGWIEGHLPPPFDENSTVICYAAAQQALGASDPAVAARLAAAVLAAADSMLTIAAASNLVDETARALLRLGTVPRDALFPILVRVGHPAEKIAPLLQEFYDAARTDGKWIANALTARGFPRKPVSAGMSAAGYPVCPLLVGVSEDAADIHYWAGAVGARISIKPEGTEFATAIRLAGYLSADVAVSCKDLPSAPNMQIMVAAAIFRGGYPLMTPIDALRDLVFAGYDARQSAALVAAVYLTTIEKLDPKQFDPSQFG